MKGSEHNDVFMKKKEEIEKNFNSLAIKQGTNNSGGTLGGISNGENIVNSFIYVKISKKYIFSILEWRSSLCQP